MNGTSGSTSFIDERGHVVISSNSSLNTTTKKYGSASAAFNGTSSYLSTPYVQNDFDLCTTDYTLEYWVNVSDLSKTSYTWSGYNIPNLIGCKATETGVNY